MSKISYWNIMTRRKPMPVCSDNEESKLGRVFGTFDLTALGVSATLGVGVYVLAGHVAKLEAGPSVILSFAIAAAASFLAGLCYAEFASRVPKSGSAYIFTYVAIGEFVAFIIGWNLLLEYIIGSASIAKGLSLYIDSLINDTMKIYFKSIAPLHLGSFLSSYFDFFAFGGPLLLGLALAFGLRKSAGMNNILCILNLGVVVFVVITVIINANLDYWQIDPNVVPEEIRNVTNIGNGGFFPFGFSGTIKGAATCFFGFVGFDCIATTGEEVKNPRKAVPRAILYSLIIIFFAYFGVALLTLMWPYYLLDADAPLPHAFQEIGWITSKWIVTIGGIVGLIASLFGAMFPLPRILYAMSIDGLIFREFSIISERFQTPVIGTLIASAITSCFAGLFDLAALVNMLSIGVLLAYTVVAISIIVLRFSHPSTPLPIINGANETSNLLRPRYNVTTKGFFMQLFRFNSSRHPNNISTTVVCVMIACYCIVSLALALLIRYRIDLIIAGEKWAIVTLISLSVTLLIFCFLISIQPKQVFNSRTKPFMVPIVPFLPAISVFINIYLMLMLDLYTWIRFGIWMIVGIFFYFPSTWIYNYKPIKITNNNMHESNTNEVEKNNFEPQEESSNAPAIMNGVTINGTTNKAPRNEKNSKMNEVETNSAIEILDTVLESEEDQLEYKVDKVKICDFESENFQRNSNEIQENFHPVPALRTSLKKNEEILNEPESSKNQNDIEVEVIVVNKLTNKVQETPKLALQIINPDEMINDIRNEINQILNEAEEKVNSFDEEISSPSIDTSNENIFQNQNFLSHLSDVLKKSPFTQTLNRVKRNERSQSFKRWKSYHTLKDFNRNSYEDIKIKIEPIDITIPGTPVSSKHLNDARKESLKSQLSLTNVVVNSQKISENGHQEKNEHENKIKNDEKKVEILTEKKELVEENIEPNTEKLKNDEKNEKPQNEPKNSLLNFKIQSATPSTPKVMKSTEIPPETKNDFKEKLSRLLSNPPPLNIFSLRPYPKSRSQPSDQVQIPVEIKQEEKEISQKNKNVEEEKPKIPKTPLALLTETMNQQRKLFDDVLKTFKNKTDEHAKDEK